MMNTTNIAECAELRSARVATEAMILQLFAPARLMARKDSAGQIENASLWRQDALHRAKNMAQMTVSLANLAEHRSRCWLPSEVVAKARGLARAYEELGTDCGTTAMVPVVPLLVTIAVRLVEIFGSARDIAVSIDADDVLLVPDMRRALILMASEMIINALKYGYPNASGGTIRVSLKNRDNGLSLIVEDDGADYSADYSASQGSALLDRLSNVLGASLVRGSGSEGHGYRVGAMVTPGQDDHLAV
ncbi:ATP-binding protein [Blastomonas aquatica]|uniref:histidine kinase n=1 Tax=Blastomonas aquatica TaxID=1510276 RepID=A0ABQ1JMX1_9SPHN|nr:ATP-binding protein [Blastomonas aquatica]GGB72332.1 hypothetical protein GCM10010833_29430 [Blastomonas aquatica]